MLKPCHFIPQLIEPVLDFYIVFSCLIYHYVDSVAGALRPDTIRPKIPPQTPHSIHSARAHPWGGKLHPEPEIAFGYNPLHSCSVYV
jgi:hypothetical protein